MGFWKKKHKILIVDDDPAVLQMLETMLETMSADLFAASNGEQALKMAFDEVPDLIVLDIMMPGMDGWEVLQTLRGIKKTEKIPVLMLTAKEMLSDAEKSFDLGAEDFVQKPISFPKLKVKIQTLLGLPVDKT